MKKIILALILCLLGTSVQAYDPALTRGMDLTYNAKFEEAEAVLNAYVASHPNDPMGYIIRGTSLDWKQMVKNLRKTLDAKILADYQQANKLAFLYWDKDQENVDRMVVLGNSYMFLAKKWLDVGKKARAGLILKKCQRHMEDAVKKDPTRFDAYMANGIFNFYAANVPPGLSMIASLLGISGNETEGLNQVKKTAENPNLFQNHALFVLTYMYGQTKKNYAQAQNYLNQLSVKFPQNPHFKFLKGEYAYRTKQYAQSRADFDQFLSFCNANAGDCVQNYLFLAHYFMAAGYVDENNVLGSKPHVEKAAELNVGQFKDRESYIFLYKGLVLKAEGKNALAKVELQKSIDAPGGNPKAKTRAKQEIVGL